MHRIPEDLLKMWMDPEVVGAQMAMKFKNTWSCQRHDLKDQTGSGYDLALANFGVGLGLSEQQIVDMIVHHRAIHHQKPRTRADYFQRTIAKAERMTGGDNSAIPTTSEAPGSRATEVPAAPGAPVAPGQERAPDTTSAPSPADPEAEARHKAQLCDRISQTLGITVVRLVKISGKEPQYRMELAGGQKIEFANVNKLIQYPSMRSAIAAAIGKLIPEIKPKPWAVLSTAYARRLHR
jgi:hypothetical protein